MLLATAAHSMTAVGGAGVGHLRGIVRDAATDYAARNGTTHPDIEAALHVLSLAAEIGSYNPSPELIPSPGRGRVLPPSPGDRHAPPLASHQREAPPGQHNAVFARKKNVSDAPFASPPERTRGSVLAQSRSTDRSGGGAPADARPRRPPGRGANPFAEAGGSLESSFEDARAGYARRRLPGFPASAPSAAARAAQRGDAVLVQLAGDGERRVRAVCD